MNIKLLTRENIPCWYELSWRQKKPAIILKIHKDFIASIKPIRIREDAPIVKTLKEQFKFESFAGNFNGNYGFDNAFVRVGKRGNFVEFVVKIPKVKKWTGEICGDCNGSGKQKFLDLRRDCFHCEGTGKECIFDWQPAYAISASFTIFTTLARFPGIETSEPFPQLITVNTITGSDMHGGSLGGEYSIPFVKWLTSLFGTNSVPEMVQAMKIAYNRMLGLHKFDQFHFRASVDYENGWLNVSCPGNACGLNPVHGAEYDMKRGLGYEFDCHNVDTPIQQITLLAGLSALHDRARKEIKI